MRLASQSVRSISFLTTSVLLAALLSMALPAEAAKNSLDAQLAFGIEMAASSKQRPVVFRIFFSEALLKLAQVQHVYHRGIDTFDQGGRLRKVFLWDRIMMLDQQDDLKCSSLCQICQPTH